MLELTFIGGLGGPLAGLGSCSFLGAVLVLVILLLASGSGNNLHHLLFERLPLELEAVLVPDEVWSA